ncbi:lysophospholipid acyltransferase family protein [Amnibacterium flavum]|uniref:1-acyl-sn-glycerol-3-phosphate acyltransferase n=1 Tax=Amnibacterium flavum TaxID=2173173 RepID=A0A2V1HTM5_9MICO|nr:lysophospholipid acyltransferase family protein [Amnibacterium flavum]PVZ95956.1 1-acyl-sn-glycerol-3-phosphate acyltransferase [Amnibacterium flavum]
MNDPTQRFRSRSLLAARFLAQRGLLKPVVWTCTRVTVVGRSRLRDLNGAFVAVAHHSSHLDAPLVFGSLPWRLAGQLAAGAAADYFFDVKWRTWLTVLFFNAFPIDRSGMGGRPRLSRSLLAAGVPILIFPEGGRARTGEGIRAFKPGAAAIAMSSGVPVLPIGIIDAARAMPRDRNWPVRGRTPVAVVFGSPLYAEEGETAEAFTSRLRGEVERLSSWSNADSSQEEVR